MNPSEPLPLIIQELQKIADAPVGRDIGINEWFTFLPRDAIGTACLDQVAEEHITNLTPLQRKYLLFFIFISRGNDNYVKQAIRILDILYKQDNNCVNETGSNILLKGRNHAGKMIKSYYHGYSPLHFASAQGHPQLLKWLLDHGAIPDARISLRHATPMHLLAMRTQKSETSFSGEKNDFIACIQLLREKAKSNSLNIVWERPAYYVEDSSIKAEIESESNNIEKFNQFSEDTSTNLIIALDQANPLHAAKHIDLKKPIPSFTNGNQAIHFLCALAHKFALDYKKSIKYESLPPSKYKYQELLKKYANIISAKEIKKASQLIDKATICKLPASAQAALLYFAIENKDKYFLVNLLIAGIDPNAPHNYSNSAVYRAMELGFTEGVILLFKHGATLTYADKGFFEFDCTVGNNIDGYYRFMLTQRQHPDIVRVLLLDYQKHYGVFPKEKLQHLATVSPNMTREMLATEFGVSRPGTRSKLADVLQDDEYLTAVHGLSKTELSQPQMSERVHYTSSKPVVTTYLKKPSSKSSGPELSEKEHLLDTENEFNSDMEVLQPETVNAANPAKPKREAPKLVQQADLIDLDPLLTAPIVPEHELYMHPPQMHINILDTGNDHRAPVLEPQKVGVANLANAEGKAQKFVEQAESNTLALLLSAPKVPDHLPQMHSSDTSKEYIELNAMRLKKESPIPAKTRHVPG